MASSDASFSSSDVVSTGVSATADAADAAGAADAIQVPLI